MFKRIMTTALALLMTGVLVGGASAADQKVLSIATGGTGGTYYALGGGISKLVAEYMPGYKLVVQSTGASIENTHLVANKRVDFAIVMPDAAYFAFKGEREFKGRAKYPNLRAVMAGHASLLQGAALASSGIKSFADLKGKKVALSAPGSPSKFVSIAALAAYGLKEGDYKATYLTYSEMVQAIKDGTIDASMVFAGVPTSSMLDLSSTEKINFLPVEKSKLPFVKENYPYYTGATIKAGTYTGQDQAVPTLAAPAILITHSDVPQEAVYQLIKTICEHREELTKLHKAGAAWNADDATEGIAIPFHTGAEKYLKEKGKLK